MHTFSEKVNQVGRLEETGDGSFTLVHPDHGESYHSSAGALQEARELYIRGSRISEAFSERKSVAVLDIGLGLGYNALATIDAWQQCPGATDLVIVSLESNLTLIDQLATTTGEWQSGWGDEWKDWCLRLAKISDMPDVWCASISHVNDTAKLTWRVFGGDARDPRWCDASKPFDYVWQDAFSSKVCPELWTAEWFRTLRNVSKDSSQLVTYSVARSVRDNLSLSGWAPLRIPGKGSKKHWLLATTV